MPINFIPNDPLAVAAVPMRQQNPRPNRAANQAGFIFFDEIAAQPFPVDVPALRFTEDFLFWQCREAALAAVEVWESLDGPLSRWAQSNNPRKLELSQNFEDPEFTGPKKLNAFYDGQGLRFFVFDDGNRKTFSGVSTDTVAHETGHALLDVLRPELFFSMLPEVNAFHEAFGDCMAILTALADQQTRQALLTASPQLDAANFVEAGSEYLSGAIRRQFGNVSPSKPRRALNTFKWQLPSSLPPGKFTDPPEFLSIEVHSFSRVFTGCFYDVLRSVFVALPNQNEAALLTAAQTVGKLLIAAVKVSTETARYFRAIGRGMVKADEQQNGGAHRQIISKAFTDHNIGLGTAAMFTPTTALAGAPPKITKTTAALSPTTSRDLRARIKAKPGAKFAINRRDMFGELVVEAVHQREVPLGAIDKRLKGVVAYAAEPVLVGSSGTRAAVLGALPEPNQTLDEVNAFVESLIRNDQIKLDTKRTRIKAFTPSEEPQAVTHVVRSKGGKKVLTRIRYYHYCSC